MKAVYLIFCVIGTLLPYGHFLPWLSAHGLNGSQFRHDLHGSGVSEFFAADVIISAIVLLTFMWSESRRSKIPAWWLAVIGTLFVGVSLGLPLFLYLRERSLEGGKVAT